MHPENEKPRMIRKRSAAIARTLAPSLMLLALLAGCAGPVTPGMPMAQALAERGTPAVRLALPGGGERVIYSNTFGQFNQVIESDATGQVRRVYNSLTDEGFAQIRIGQWTQEDVRAAFGRPAETTIVGFAEKRARVWSYRYRQDGVWNSLMHVHFGEDGRVSEFYPGPDPLFEPKEGNK
ncbi:MAG TPA: hypothetical protein VFK82_08655 [Burkholderiaceae bacterium]|nr:hypothetical protein [Burkholderiaceae bacterium]